MNTSLRIPGLLTKWLLLWCCLLVVFSPTDAQDEASDITGRVNSLRASKGLPAYTVNGALTAAAQSQANWLVANGCAIAHTHPDGSNPRSRARDAGYSTDYVGENIYCGGLARVNDAWTFWLNSGIHYAGLVNTRYKEVGVAVGHGAAGQSYVIVFGNPGGPDFVPPAAVGSSGSSASGAAPGLPPYVVGWDEHGNIKHEIQPGDTLGQIALNYGYTWNDIPAMLALNGLTEADYRKLKEGAVFLVPPKAGTYTPTPGELPSATTEASTLQPDPTHPPTATEAPTLSLVPTIPPVATANNVPDLVAALVSTPTPEPSLTPQSVALVASPVPQFASAATNSNPPSWLIVALAVQVVLVLGAGLEFLRRTLRRR
ncbi:MAG: CAP domain-containing protein [Anaerolineae bacterium]